MHVPMMAAVLGTSGLPKRSEAELKNKTCNEDFFL
jgi:hypothetical protein